MLKQSNKIDFNGKNIYVGFDVHLKSWKVTVMTEKLTHKTFSQPPKPEVLGVDLRTSKAKIYYQETLPISYLYMSENYHYEESSKNIFDCRNADFDY
ncbi:MAG: hypothetical protein HN686_19100 [Bacteroidetes bacterium]|jgi:hypothetical protein|nr:hypothetical protein [Bacteroidota bacterium]MBT4412428.1 hypothetical protein [Bacteroidota bacterium]MBT7466104.1 hypothetical protein [Bacteroidota bacterium]